ncbi:hypothetical protein RND71_019156 [Anisodus tanguticus]|uniref:Uncharacterized protein n=1 Tax=Anisodus tanguticus TaxID=243964 RepID=A0AAE1VG73_9SOLA|nr:hypothetical protein RND71_019156 [Anisodus tanguticus]
MFELQRRILEIEKTLFSVVADTPTREQTSTTSIVRVLDEASTDNEADSLSDQSRLRPPLEIAPIKNDFPN